MLTRTANPTRLVAAFALTTLAPTLTPALADWPTSAGGTSARNGRPAGTNIFGPLTPDIRWQGGRPAIIAQQGVSEGDLLVLPRWDSFTTGGWIVAMDVVTGVERWAVQLPITTAGAGNHRPTAIRDGRIFANRAGNDRLEYLYALDPIDGSVLWRSDDMITESYTESLAFTSDGDIIATRWDIFGSGSNELLRIDAETGDTMWRLPRSVPSSNGQDAAIFGDRAYIWEASPGGPIITAIDTTSGARLYSSPPVSAGLVQQVALFTGPDGTIYTPRTQNNPQTDFFVAWEDTGTALVEKWRIPMGYTPFATHAIAHDGSVYTYDTVRDGSLAYLTIHRRNPATGAIIDSSDPILCDFPAGPRMSVDFQNNLYLTNGSFANGALISFNIDLTERWRIAIPNINTAGPTLTRDGTLIAAGIGTSIRAFWTEYGSPCYANCDLSFNPPILNVDDFTCFINEYAAAQSLPHAQQINHYANCDGSSVPPVLNVDDFTCFINEFAQGCP